MEMHVFHINRIVTLDIIIRYIIIHNQVHNFLLVGLIIGEI